MSESAHFVHFHLKIRANPPVTDPQSGGAVRLAHQLRRSRSGREQVDVQLAATSASARSPPKETVSNGSVFWIWPRTTEAESWLVPRRPERNGPWEKGPVAGDKIRIAENATTVYKHAAGPDRPAEYC